MLNRTLRGWANYKQHVVADVEQVSPPPCQVIKDRLFVHQQPVVTAIQLVDLGQPGILAQEIGQGAVLKPLTVQPPFAARRQQAVGDQYEQDLIPASLCGSRRAACTRIDPAAAPATAAAPASTHPTAAAGAAATPTT